MDNISTNTKTKISRFTDLDVWKEGHRLVLAIYKISSSFPKSEDFGLKSQLRRSAVSVTSNIAEGFSRNSRGDKTQFYTIALSSLTELENQILVGRDVNYIDNNLSEELLSQVLKVQKMLSGLIKTARDWGEK